MANSVSTASHAKVFQFFLTLLFLLLILFYLSTQLHLSYPLHRAAKIIIRGNSFWSLEDYDHGCNDLHGYENSEAKCTYLTSTVRCDPQGYMNYLRFFYCVCGNHPALGYILLLMCLILLFYLLGNTAALYFCSNLEGLTRLLKLSPTIAGVTLLALGNGAPDIFSSIVSFMEPDTNVVGLNSILGAAFFVSCVVVGTISICAGPREIIIDKWSFIRDLGFLLFILLVLLMIIIIGNINVFCALAFTSLYLVYVLFVSTGNLFWKEDEEEKGPIDVCAPSCSRRAFSFQAGELGELGAPVLKSMADMDELILIAEEGRRANEPNSTETCIKITSSISSCFCRILLLLELPLCLPRRLTIPDVSEERWSKPYAVASATFAPVFLAVIWDSKGKEKATEERMVIYLFGGLIGMAFGIAAFLKTKRDRPPKKFLCPWLAGGFLMSVVWVCIIAQELVSLLLSIGVVLEISPSLLGLSVLAWGNSLGDLVSNVFVALQDKQGGAQVAISGSYGGPIFNILVGLGLPLLFSSWATYPSPLVIPKDPTLFQTVGFLLGGLLWALLMLPRRGMKLDRVFGCGLLAVYLCFMSLRFVESLGFLHVDSNWTNLVQIGAID